MGARVAVVKSPEELTDRFRSQGLKVTPQRQAIFRILHGSTVHPTAESVHAEVVEDLPMVSLRTVYQTLNELTAMGELGQLDVGRGSARFDPNLDPHQHLVCSRCGQVEDIFVDVPAMRVPTDPHGFTVTHTEVVFRGVCAACVDADRPTSTPNNPTTRNKEA